MKNLKKDKNKKKKETKKKVEEEEEWSGVSEEEEEEVKDKPKQQKYVLYKLLNVERTATSVQIKTSYKKLALQIHPDKNKDDPEAAQKFNKLTEAYKILMDAQKRKVYDQTGIFGDDLSEQAFQSAYQYYRSIYKKIEKEDIESFEKRYRFGVMEEEDLLNFYNNYNGDLVLLLEHIPLSLNQDVPRFIKFFETKIAQKILNETKDFKRTKNKVKKIKFEDDEVEEYKMQRLKETKEDFAALQLAILGKKSNFLEELEKKYCTQNDNKKGNKQKKGTNK